MGGVYFTQDEVARPAQHGDHRGEIDQTVKDLAEENRQLRMEIARLKGERF
jgi:hypothetical protein